MGVDLARMENAEKARRLLERWWIFNSGIETLKKGDLV